MSMALPWPRSRKLSGELRVAPTVMAFYGSNLQNENEAELGTECIPLPLQGKTTTASRWCHHFRRRRWAQSQGDPTQICQHLGCHEQQPQNEQGKMRKPAANESYWPTESPQLHGAAQSQGSPKRQKADTCCWISVLRPVHTQDESSTC